jgi:hypothetical protein
VNQTATDATSKVASIQAEQNKNQQNPPGRSGDIGRNVNEPLETPKNENDPTICDAPPDQETKESNSNRRDL